MYYIYLLGENVLISYVKKFQGDYIWIEPISGREFDVAIGARVISAEGKRIQVKDDDGRVSLFYCINCIIKCSTINNRYEKIN